MHRTHKIKKRYCLLWANDFSIFIEPTEYDIVNHFVRYNGSVAQWITRLTTNQEIAGLTPARVDEYFNFTVHGKNITHSWFGIIISLKLTFKYSTFDSSIGILSYFICFNMINPSLNILIHVQIASSNCLSISVS